MTIILSCAMIAIFAIDYQDHSMIKTGYISGNLLKYGEWWRLLTAPYLHLNVAHITSNVFALLLVGLRAEALIGSAKSILIFLISACVGALGSAAINPPNVGSVGASGAIQGLISAVYVVGLVRGRRTEEGRRICRDAFGLGILTMAYASISDFLGRAFGVDLSAHVCGAIAGGLAALVLLMPSDASAAVNQRSDGQLRIWRTGAGGLLIGMVLLLATIIILRPVLPYVTIRLAGIAAVLLIALAAPLYDTLASPAPATDGAPFTFRRVVRTQGRTIVLTSIFAAIWALCMYFR